MQQLVRVRTIHEDGTATVMHIRESACSGDCHKCSGCGAAKEAILLEAVNPIGAKPGDFVEVEPTGVGNISVSFIVFLLPCIGLALGYVFAQSVLHMGEMSALLGALAGLALGFVPAFLINRSIVKRDKPEFRVLKFLLR